MAVLSVMNVDVNRSNVDISCISFMFGSKALMKGTMFADADLFFAIMQMCCFF